MTMIENALDKDCEGPSLREFLIEALGSPGPWQSYFSYDADEEPLLGVVVAQDDSAKELEDLIM